MRKFLASVGNAKLLGKKNGELVHIADVRTLTESTLSFANTMEEVRAGEGAQLYGRFAHDSGMTVTLTDAMFDLEYIAQQVGAEIQRGATGFYIEERSYKIPQSTAVTLGRTAMPIGNACGLNTVFAWVRQKGCGVNAEWKGYEITNNQISAEDMAELTAGATSANPVNLCVQYFVSRPEARMLSISANFIPAELILILTTKLFAGDANAPETGKPVGEITVKIPRFSLDGTFDLSMAMSAAATMSLNGTALAVEDGTCDGKGVYAEIVEVLTNSSVLDGLKEILVDPEDSTAAALVVYAMYGDGHVSLLDNEFYTTSTVSDTKYITVSEPTDLGADSLTNYKYVGATKPSTGLAVGDVWGPIDGKYYACRDTQDATKDFEVKLGTDFYYEEYVLLA